MVIDQRPGRAENQFLDVLFFQEIVRETQFDRTGRGELPSMIFAQLPIKTAEVFLKHGMHCIGCAAARFETLAEGAMAHGIELDPFLDDLNKVVEKKKSKKK